MVLWDMRRMKMMSRRRIEMLQLAGQIGRWRRRMRRMGWLLLLRHGTGVAEMADMTVVTIVTIGRGMIDGVGSSSSPGNVNDRYGRSSRRQASQRGDRMRLHS